MSESKNTPITDLDFLDIKEGLKDFLKGQDRFKDYNFEGSNLSVLLDVLAYNSFQNNFFTNMAINEMFLDSAQIYSSVVSHAKTLNYVPRSKISSKAILDVTLNVADNPEFITIPSRTKFTAKCGNQTFTFYNEESRTVESDGYTYTARDLVVFEGKYTSEVFRVDGNRDQYILSNRNIDTSSIRVFVKESVDSEIEEEYVFSDTIFGIEPNDKIFYIQAEDKERYRIVFGLDRFGHQPKNSARILVEYRMTSGSEGNGIINIALADKVSGYRGVVKVKEPSKGGFDEEDIESIKYFAPKSIQVQDRAITESDYEVLLRSRFPEIQAVSVYGGETLNPPRYGKVVIAVDIFGADGVSDNDKDKYVTFLKRRSPMSVDPIIVNPEFMYISINSRVYFNTRKSSKSPADVRQIVHDAIINFSEENLNRFKVPFRISNLHSVIDNANRNILSNDIKATAVISLNPMINSDNEQLYDFTFNNELITDHVFRDGETIKEHISAIRSTPFTYENQTSFLMDDGNGNIHIYRLSDNTAVIMNRDVGKVNYLNGNVSIRNFKISGYEGSGIKIHGRTKIPTIIPPNNRLIVIRSEDISIDVIGIQE